jgi:hypothetical protein
MPNVHAERRGIMLTVFMLAAFVGLALVSGAAAQGYDFLIRDLPAPINMSRVLVLRGITADGSLAADDLTRMDPGEHPVGARIAPDLTVTPIRCPLAAYVPGQSRERGGPQIQGITDTGVIIGNDLAFLGGRDVAIGVAQYPDGHCRVLQIPGKASVIVLGANDNEDMVGIAFNPLMAGVPPLLRFQGFLAHQDGTVELLTGPQPNDVVWPTALNASGLLIGYIYRNVGADNSYEYKAFVRPAGGSYTFLEGPGGENVYLTGLNNAGIAVGVTGTDTAVEGQGVLYDHPTATIRLLPLPTPTTTRLIARALNHAGVIVGQYEDGGVTHQFLATPRAELQTPKKKTERSPRWWWRVHQHGRRLVAPLHTPWTRAERPEDDDDVPGRWHPAQRSDGALVLTDGTSVVGN